MSLGQPGTRPRVQQVSIDEASVTVAIWDPNGSDRAIPEIVMLHDGLGSIGQWSRVPGQIAAVTGKTVMAFDRSGHGKSTPVPTESWQTYWLHHEARVLKALLHELEVKRPLLIGHSDGGSIALLLAASNPGAVRGILALAAHSYVEPKCVDTIREMRHDNAGLMAGLSRHHEHPAALFEAWSGVWTSDAFASWDIRDRLGAIAAPTLVVQGVEDEYGTDEMAVSTAFAIGQNAECVLLPKLGHLIHHQAPADVVALAQKME